MFFRRKVGGVGRRFFLAFYFFVSAGGMFFHSGCETTEMVNEYREKFALAKERGIPLVVWEIAPNPVYHPFMRPNSAGGVDVKISIKNTGRKTIKYVTFEVLPFNAVNDEVSDSLGRGSFRSLGYTGPLSVDETATTFWENVWYHNGIKTAVLTGVKVEFMDGEVAAYDASELEGLLLDSRFNSLPELAED